MTYTSVICGCSMLVYLASGFVPAARFGGLMFTLIFAAILGDFILLPALLTFHVGNRASMFAMDDGQTTQRALGRNASFCARCAAELHPGSGDFYVVKIEAVADPTPPVFSAEDLAERPHGEIERVLAQAQQLSEQELVDQVYRRLILYLCGLCYRE